MAYVDWSLNGPEINSRFAIAGAPHFSKAALLHGFEYTEAEYASSTA